MEAAAPGREGWGPPRRYNTFRGPHEDRCAWKRVRNPPGTADRVHGSNDKGTRAVVPLRQASWQKHISLPRCPTNLPKKGVLCVEWHSPIPVLRAT